MQQIFVPFKEALHNGNIQFLKALASLAQAFFHRFLSIINKWGFGGLLSLEKNP